MIGRYISLLDSALKNNDDPQRLTMHLTSITNIHRYAQNIETLQKKAIGIVHSKWTIAHTEPILKKTINQLILSDMYTCHLLKLYYKLYRNRLPSDGDGVPTYFENFIPEYGESSHNLRDRHIHLTDVRCEFGKLNAKYQMHLRLRELALPSNPPIYP